MQPPLMQIIGAIKIRDALFIGDVHASKVEFNLLGPRLYYFQQGFPHHQLRRSRNLQPLRELRNPVPHSPLGAE